MRMYRNFAGMPKMTCRAGLLVLPLTVFSVRGQQAPPSPDKAWPVSLGFDSRAEVVKHPARPALDPNRVYTLPDLVDIA